LAKVRKLVCINCGNTERFIVDSRRECVGVTISFREGFAELEDEDTNSIEVFPSTCAECGAEVGYDAGYSGAVSAPFGWVIEEKKAVVCDKCNRRFKCFTSREPCKGFRFKEEMAEI